jgi:DNA repair ATPase RecN
MERWCRIQLAAVLFLAAGVAAAAAPPLPTIIQVQAASEARLAVARDMAGRHPELMGAYQRLADAVQPLNKAQAEVNMRQNKLNALQPPLRHILQRLKEWSTTGYVYNGVHYYEPNAYYMVNEWKKKLVDISEKVQFAEQDLTVAEQQLADAQSEYNKASQNYTDLVGSYQEEFNKLY